MKFPFFLECVGLIPLGNFNCLLVIMIGANKPPSVLIDYVMRSYCVFCVLSVDLIVIGVALSASIMWWFPCVYMNEIM